MEGGIDERRPPLPIRPVRIGSSGQQDLDRRFVPFQSGMNQQGSTRFVGSIDPFPGREQCFDDLRVVVPDGQIQSRLALIGFQLESAPAARSALTTSAFPCEAACIRGVRPWLSRLSTTAPARIRASTMGAKPWYAAAAKGPLPSLSRKLGGGAVSQQEPGRFGLPPRRRMHQERYAVDVHLIDVGAMADQQGGRSSVALEQRQGESRPVVPAPGPDLGPSFEQRLHHRQVALG